MRRLPKLSKDGKQVVAVLLTAVFFALAFLFKTPVLILVGSAFLFYGTLIEFEKRNY